MAAQTACTGRRVIVDDREVRLHERMVARFPDVPCTRSRLTTGDVHVTHGADTLLVVERKTRADLRASLLDGRFHTQRARMVAEFGAAAVAFVVEGGTDWAEPESGAELGIVLRDRIPLFWTGGIDDTAALVARLASADLAPRAAPPSGDNAVRVAAATAECAERSLAAMLRCVPQVSARRAALIAAEFKSMATLGGAAADDPAGTTQRLADMRTPGTGAAHRRLGVALAQRIVACLAGERPQVMGRE